MAGINLATANTWTGNITISNTAPTLTLTDTTASAKSLTIAVDANIVSLRESAGASGSLAVLDLANATLQLGSADITNLPTYPGWLRIFQALNGPENKGGVEFVEGGGGALYGTKLYTNNTSDYFGIATRFNSATWTERVVILNASGKMGLGMVPTSQLELSTDDAKKPTTNTWTIASDARFKTVQRPFADGLAVLKQINPVWYRYNGKAGYKDNGEHVGILAQDLLPVAPYMIGTFQGNLEQWADLPDKDGKLQWTKKKQQEAGSEEVMLYDYQGHALPFILVNAVKELDARLLALGG